MIVAAHKGLDPPIGEATPTSSADRPLLRRRSCANLNQRLWLHPDDRKGSQHSQFTGPAFTGVLAKSDIRISMDGKGAWRDNVFVERLWRSMKYEEVSWHAYDTVRAAREGIGRYLDLYNRRRPHSALDGRTPDDAYFAQENTPPIRLAA